MRISDWSSDVCSSDLQPVEDVIEALAIIFGQIVRIKADMDVGDLRDQHLRPLLRAGPPVARTLIRPRPDRKRVVSGTSVSVRVDLGVRRILKQTNRLTQLRHSNAYIYTLSLPY